MTHVLNTVLVVQKRAFAAIRNLELIAVNGTGATSHLAVSAASLGAAQSGPRPTSTMPPQLSRSGLWHWCAAIR